MKILHLDIETAPNLAHVWGIWQQNVGLPQLLESGYVLCWAAKWHQEPEVYFAGLNTHSKRQMLQEIWDILDEADVVVHYNGKSFDIPTLNGEFVEEGMTPPSQYKQIDLLKAVKSQFRFPSNKLAYVAPRLGVGRKVVHTGHQLWIDCMAGDKKAWKLMEKYNRQDTMILEDLYNKILPWIPGHPNRALYEGVDAIMCRCGSLNYTKQGVARTPVGVYQQYKCKDCGSWFRGRQNIAERGNIAVNVV